MDKINRLSAGKWVHNKTGHIYVVISMVTNTTNKNDGDQMVLYQRNGMFFVRDVKEFISIFTLVDKKSEYRRMIN